jgi:hypothetical protein
MLTVLLDAALPAWPPYRKMVRAEAKYLIEIYGPRAREHALSEADDTLAPLWATYMRRVERAIDRKERRRAMRSERSRA